MALECLHTKQLRPKKDLYEASKLADIGDRSIAVTSVMAKRLLRVIHGSLSIEALGLPLGLKEHCTGLRAMLNIDSSIIRGNMLPQECRNSKSCLQGSPGDDGIKNFITFSLSRNHTGFCLGPSDSVTQFFHRRALFLHQPSLVSRYWTYVFVKHVFWTKTCPWTSFCQG